MDPRDLLATTSQKVHGVRDKMRDIAGESLRCSAETAPMPRTQASLPNSGQNRMSPVCLLATLTFDTRAQVRALPALLGSILLTMCLGRHGSLWYPQRHVYSHNFWLSNWSLAMGANTICLISINTSIKRIGFDIFHYLLEDNLAHLMNFRIDHVTHRDSCQLSFVLWSQDSCFHIHKCAQNCPTIQLCGLAWSIKTSVGYVVRVSLWLLTPAGGNHGFRSWK